jgi:multidrug efflux pump subunit AcrA (membrane-fusion protein)
MNMTRHFHAKPQSRKGLTIVGRWIVGVILGVVGLVIAGCTKADDHPRHSAPVFWCPMHPEVTSTNPNAKCDKCGGMKLLPKDEPAPTASTAASPSPPRAGQFTCPMHPQIVSPKPGDCPICKMALVPVTDTQNDGTIRVNAATRQTIGLKFGKVEKRNLQREVRAAARIVTDETRLYHVTVKLDGWIEHLFAATTGQYVKQGEPLLSIYSPDLLAGQREYLAAYQSDNANLIAAAKRRLELWDITDAQIASLQKSGTPERVMTLAAPASGWITERNIAAGHKVMASEILLTLADLTTVWADAELFQSDLATVTVGASVELNVDGYTAAGKVTFVSPTLDPMTRTAKARVELPNADLRLKPEMLATARIAVEQGSQLAVPVDAVMRTGENNYVFRASGNDVIEPVRVKIGARCGDWFPLLGDTLKEADSVVVSANFLIDSEAQVKGALNAMEHQHR